MSQRTISVGGVPRAIAALVVLAVVGAALFAFAGELAGVLTRRRVDTAKALIAAAAAAVLLVDLGSKQLPDRWRRLCGRLLALLAAAAGLAWWNFMQFHYDHYLHYSDTFHYYVGSKYVRELGYTRLYACAVVAEAEANPNGVPAERTLSDLATNRIVRAGDVLADPAACKRHFRSERWRAFVQDIGWFRAKVPKERWSAIQRDHGYNPPPAWGLLGGTLANLGPASDRQILALCLLDPLLLAAMWAAVAWAFGSRALFVAIVFWGTNAFSVFGWNGGAYLRQGWLVAAVLGVCCLRRERPFTAGLCLALATALRIFPGALLVGLALRAAWGLFDYGRITRSDLRLALGCGVAAIAIGAATLPGSGADSGWLAFVDNSRLHLATPLKNHVGLRTVLAHDADSVDRLVTGGTSDERYLAWRSGREKQFERRAPAYWAAVAAFLGLLTLAVRRQSDWVAAVLGIGLIPVAFELTNYYYSILLAYGLLSIRWRDLGVVLCGVAAATWVIADHWHWQDEIHTWSSVLVVLFVFYATERVRRERGRVEQLN